MNREEENNEAVTEEAQEPATVSETNDKIDGDFGDNEGKQKVRNSDITDVLLQYQDDKQHTATEKKENQSAWAHLTPKTMSPKKAVFNHFPAYFYAGFWMRLWAYLFDLLCVFFISDIVLRIIGFVIYLGPPFVAVIKVFIYLSYFILLTKLNHGQTLGKAVMGLRVVCFNEAELSWGTVLVREGAARFVLQLGVFCVFYILTAFTSKKQHVGDLFADTSVVTLNQLKAYQGLEQ